MIPFDDNEVFETLSGSRLRLTVVEWLSTRRPPVDLDELSQDVSRAHSLSAELVALRLHHIHLPKLARLGLFTYDTDERRVENYSQDVLDELVEWVGGVVLGDIYDGVGETSPADDFMRTHGVDRSPPDTRDAASERSSTTVPPPREDAED